MSDEDPQTVIISIRCRATFLVAAIFTAACGSLSTLPGRAKPPGDQYVRYRCADAREFGVTYQQRGTRALLEAEGWSYLLRPVTGAGGAQYSDGKMTLRTQGRSAALDHDGVTTHHNCNALSVR